MNDEEGSTTIVSAGMIVMIVVIVGILAHVFTIMVEAHQARNAADLAAVAGAYELATGHPGCPRAVEIVQLHEAEPRGCREIDGDIYIQVRMGTQLARARAGRV
ncbi:pilus assembly protein TadG-related protein [Corynebacterium sp. ES2794-CONJ1]|uniref:Rv3654c family TadE-like protein n=1 Tax=unclassified Corynebacterium TaxID=2624378 RepID=UPI002167CFD4|nr:MULTISPECIES: Rv3654c family TadE-like protein [unclassified Corynebacterium]MCS4490108.1 pilus assembly protein TadG-related protein [Corynebacterium sp. ES2775-CONJ]MCS4492083.1 pilus assembly protein TadG-related protein [Corynebacterium sp. ES2715-CONJ3]MCS4532191.1 pilus assembly protein TadG-related protein [Corynebacterium sp. ES2730-CONJ]MCU9519587.1 pilus assembly protein TadG-related protein [Corynebacterium sp. ES2794-CONJ1]